MQTSGIMQSPSTQIDGYTNMVTAGPLPALNDNINRLASGNVQVSNGMEAGAVVGAAISSFALAPLDLMVGNGNQLNDQSSSLDRFESLGVAGTVGYGVTYAATAASDAAGVAAGTVVGTADIGLKPGETTTLDWLTMHAGAGATVLSNVTSSVLTISSTLALDLARSVSAGVKVAAVTTGAVIGAGFDLAGKILVSAKNFVFGA